MLNLGGANTNLTVTGIGNNSIGLTALQTVDYTYHIRGWLKGINPTLNSSEGDLFSYNIDYETAGYYDGNIGKATWQSPDTPLSCAKPTSNYVFEYDKGSRLKKATYSGNGNYSLPNMVYDLNGNIKNLQRNGKNGNTFGMIDDLSYSLIGNRLASITDNITGSHEVDLMPRLSGAYSYWPDGSLKSDDNESINKITYDSYLKQPILIEMNDGRTLKNEYNGAGNLVKTIYSTGETWDYIDGIVFKNNIPHQLDTPEGRATFENGAWNYEYSLKDHLGNTRVSFANESNKLVVKSVSSFDPWGVKLNGQGGINSTIINKFEIQNHEKESTFGLNRINFGARTLNPTNGIWDKIDPLADKLPFSSPYVFASNNPINRIDPDGNSDFGVNDWIKFANGRVGFDANVKAPVGQTVTSKGQQGTSLGASAVLSNGNSTISLNADGTATNAVPLNEVTVSASASENTIGNVADAFGLSNDANAGVQMLDKTDDAASGFATVGKALDVVGKATGIFGAVGSFNEFRQNKTVGNFLKLGTDVGLVAFKVNPLVAIGDGLLSVTGVKDAGFRMMDNAIDTYKLKQVIKANAVNTNNLKIR